MRAEIEPIAGIIRVFKNNGTHGDPYVWSATIRYIKKGVVEICGVSKPLTLAMWRAIYNMFLESEVNEVHLSRNEVVHIYKKVTENNKLKFERVQ